MLIFYLWRGKFDPLIFDVHTGLMAIIYAVYSEKQFAMQIRALMTYLQPGSGDIVQVSLK